MAVEIGKTLADYIDHGLNILSIGLNPSTISVEKGFYFANPRNRFWRALNASGLVPEEIIPSGVAQVTLLRKYRIGFTDVVKRHSAMGKDLRAEDYKRWVPELAAKIAKYQPGVCWFHGKIAIKGYLKYSDSEKMDIEWGRQRFKIYNSTVFVTPNPSPANAAYSLQDITNWYKKLSDLNVELRR